MRADLLEEIRRDLPTYSRSAQRVAQYICAQPRDVVHESLENVAQGAGVSEPTVIRFCRTIGLDGFRALKTHLAASLQQPGSYVHNAVAADADAERAVGKVLENAIRALMDLRASADHLPFEAATEMLVSARQIVFLGVGASGIVAQDACHKFFRLGIPCSTGLDAQTISQRVAIADPEDVFIVCSHNGNWPELVRGVAEASSRGAMVIAVTDPTSQVAAHATLTFACHPAEDTSVHTPMTSRLSQLALLDALQVALALKLGISAEQKLKAAKDALYAPSDASPPTL